MQVVMNEQLKNEMANFDFSTLFVPTEDFKSKLFNGENASVNYLEPQNGDALPETTIHLETLRKLRNEIELERISRNR